MLKHSRTLSTFDVYKCHKYLFEFSNKTEILWKIQSVASVKHKNQNKRSSLFDVQSDYSVTNQ